MFYEHTRLSSTRKKMAQLRSLALRAQASIIVSAY
jgi:hypothetical protein